MSEAPTTGGLDGGDTAVRRSGDPRPRPTAAAETAPAWSAPSERLGRWRGVRRLLAVRLDNLGDVLMTTPALAALRETWPSARLTLLGSPAAAALAGHLPMVDEVWTFSAPWMRAGLAAEDAATLGAGESALIDRLAAARFDAVVIFTVCTQSALPVALLCRLAGIPLRLAHCRENPYALLTDWVPETDAIASDMRHEVLRQLALVTAVGASTADDRLRFTVHDADRLRLAGRLTALGIGRGQRYAVLHPGATAASRRWPAARFGAVAAALAAQRGCAAVFSGDGGGDVALVEAARREMALAVPAPASASAGFSPLVWIPRAPSDAAATTVAATEPASTPAPAPALPVASVSVQPPPVPPAGRPGVLAPRSLPAAPVADSQQPDGGHAASGNVPAVSLAGVLSLGEFAALVEGASVLIANNSLPAHLAAALGTPVVDLYALTNPQHTPWRVASRVLSHDVPCRWCLKSSCPQRHHDCLRGVAAQQVVDAALDLLDTTGPTRPLPRATDARHAPAVVAAAAPLPAADADLAADVASAAAPPGAAAVAPSAPMPQLEPFA